jgi:hypothetical protein
MEELRREQGREQAPEDDLPCDRPMPRARTRPDPPIWCGRQLGSEEDCAG